MVPPSPSYVNGVAQTVEYQDTQSNLPLATNNSAVEIGRRSGASPLFDGVIDDAAVYESALSFRSPAPLGPNTCRNQYLDEATQDLLYSYSRSRLHDDTESIWPSPESLNPSSSPAIDL